MRKIIEKQLKFGQVDISSIELDLRSRDEISTTIGWPKGHLRES